MARTLKDILDHADELAAQLEGDPTIVREVPRAEQELRLAAISRAQAERRVAETVTAARREGVSWARIGKALGTTAQSAQHRYRELVPSGPRKAAPIKPTRSRRAAKS